MVGGCRGGWGIGSCGGGQIDGGGGVVRCSLDN